MRSEPAEALLSLVLVLALRCGHGAKPELRPSAAATVLPALEAAGVCLDVESFQGAKPEAYTAWEATLSIREASRVFRGIFLLFKRCDGKGQSYAVHVIAASLRNGALSAPTMCVNDQGRLYWFNTPAYSRKIRTVVSPISHSVSRRRCVALKVHSGR